MEKKKRPPVHINIAKLVGEMKIQTTNFKEGVNKAQSMVSEALMMAINDAQLDEDGKTKKTISAAIFDLAKTFKKERFVAAMVIKVEKTKKICFCVPLEGSSLSPIDEVLLLEDPGSEWLIIPEIDSRVMIGLDWQTKPYVAMFSKIAAVEKL